MAIKVGILGTAHGHVMNYGRKWIENPQWNIELVGAWDHDKARLEANANAVFHTRTTQSSRFHLCGCNLKAANIDHIITAACKEQTALFVKISEIV